MYNQQLADPNQMRADNYSIDDELLNDQDHFNEDAMSNAGPFVNSQMNLQSSRSGKFYEEGGSRISSEDEHQGTGSQNYEPPNQIEMDNLDDELLGDSPLQQP